VQQEPTTWLVPGLIPFRAISELAGDPAHGKSAITHDLAARLTVGRPMPLSESALPPAGVVLLQAEDPLATRVKPALLAAGADIGRVLVNAREQSCSQPLSLPGDLKLIEPAVDDIGAKLVVIDPVLSFLSVNANSERGVRNVPMLYV
jgi:hypothetical protein